MTPDLDAMSTTRLDSIPAIVPLDTLAYADWHTLWLDYVGPYVDALPSEIHRSTFERLCSAADALHGIAATRDGRPVGFAHFYFHPSTFSLAPVCTLDDLYVAPAARGQGIARRLIDAVARRAEANGAGALHWKTRAANTAAVALYDRLATRTDFLSYRMALPRPSLDTDRPCP